MNSETSIKFCLRNILSHIILMIQKYIFWIWRYFFNIILLCKDSVLSILYTVYCILYTVYCILYTVHYILYTVSALTTLTRQNLIINLQRCDWNHTTLLLPLPAERVRQVLRLQVGSSERKVHFFLSHL